MDWHQDVLMSHSTDGLRVAEVDSASSAIDVKALVQYARDQGAELVWVHGGDLAEEGFSRAAGYTQFRGTLHDATSTAEIVDLADSPGLLTEAYSGLWGHKRMDGVPNPVDEQCIALGLRERDELVGVCQVWTATRLVDGPGVVPAWRTVGRKVQLLAAAGTILGPAPFVVDTWGEDEPTIRAYQDLGLSINVETAGWELTL